MVSLLICILRLKNLGRILKKWIVFDICISGYCEKTMRMKDCISESLKMNVEAEERRGSSPGETISTMSVGARERISK